MNNNLSINRIKSTSRLFNFPERFSPKFQFSKWAQINKYIQMIHKPLIYEIENAAIKIMPS